jgi:serine/threonine protein kinase
LPLQPGKALGPYEVLAPLGAGGMGEVYRARDTRLGRQVALKTLPAGVAADADRLARFDREARALAALNHPSIGAIYGLEEAEGMRVLVLELVEGETLADRIRRGALPADEALRVATQIADALDAAHAQGILHRDIKPANIFVTTRGVAKVLDFGLAKLANGGGSSPALSHSPTLTAAATRDGVIVGTAPYMSPEQARGKAVDGGTDVWSFGCVLYEMLTGRMAFGGETVSDVIAAVLGRDPDWSKLPQTTTLVTRRLLRRCLEKDPKRRLHHFGDVRIEIEDALAGREESTPSHDPAAPARIRRARAITAAVALLVLGAYVGPRLRGGAAAPPLADHSTASRLTNLGGSESSGALTPDGRSFAFVSSHAGTPDIWRRQVSGGEPVRLASDAAVEAELAFAPDGETIYFTRFEGAARSIWRIGALGGQARRVASEAWLAAPSPDGQKLAYYGRDREGAALMMSAADGSGPRALTRDARPSTACLAWAPDSRRLALTRGGLFTPSNLFVVDTESGAVRQVTRFERAGQGVNAQRWLPDGRRLVVAYSIEGWIDQNDLGVLDVETGAITRLTLRVGQVTRELSLSADGSRLVASTSELRRELWKVPLGADPDANGRAAARILDDSRDPMWTFVSRDGRTLLFNSTMTGSRNLWTMSLDASAPPRQITELSGGAVMHSSLSPDGGRVAFVSGAAGHSDIWTQATDGSDLRQLTNDEAADAWPVWSPDGRSIVFNSLRDGQRQTWRMPSEGGGPAQKLVDGFFRGDWIARPGGTGTLIATSAGAGTGARLIDVERATVVWERPVAGSELGLPVFSPDGRSISLVGRDGSGRDVVWALDTATGDPRLVVRFPGEFRTYFRANWVDGGRALVVNRFFQVSRIELFDRLASGAR